MKKIKDMHMKLIKILIASISIFLTSSVLASNIDKTYKIAIDASYPPFSYKNTKGVFEGIEIDLLDAIAKDQGFNYELVVMNFDGVIPGIISGQIDGAIDGINMSEDRKKIVDFSDPYFTSGLCIVTRKDNTKIKSIDDIKDTMPGIKKGTYGMEFAEKNKEKYNLNLRYFTMTTDVVQAVKSKAVDFYMEDYPVISYAIKSGLENDLRIAVKDMYGNPTYGFAVKKGENSLLLNMFNTGLKNLKDNGQYQKIIDKYI